MLDRTKHEITMRNILDDIYTNHKISSILGFKGGTACYFFYNLPRFSTDLDFNLLDLDKKDQVFSELQSLLEKHGEITDSYKKTNTLFFLVSHTSGRSGIKIEVSTREEEKVNSYEPLEFFGTTVLVMLREDIFANKLLALTHRHAASARDLFDINYFFSKNWDVNEGIVREIAGKEFIEYMEELPNYISANFSSRNVHEGLGEFLSDQSQRDFVKRKLIEDTTHKIRFFIESYKRNSS